MMSPQLLSESVVGTDGAYDSELGCFRNSTSEQGVSHVVRICNITRHMRIRNRASSLSKPLLVLLPSVDVSCNTLNTSLRLP